MDVNRIVVGSAVAIMFCSEHIVPGRQDREVQLHGEQRLLLFGYCNGSCRDETTSALPISADGHGVWSGFAEPRQDQSKRERRRGQNQGCLRVLGTPPKSAAVGEVNRNCRQGCFVKSSAMPIGQLDEQQAQN